jgi:uncharacterized surface protein with fasciclin (FAS1) repeats
MLKNLKSLLQYSVLLMAVFALAACSNSSHGDGDGTLTGAQSPTLNIVETAEENGNFSNLLAALEAAELDDDLAGPGPFTVFAPTDAAFALIPQATIDFLFSPAGKATLEDILLFHVLSGNVASSTALALDGTSATMLNNLNLRIDNINGDLVLSLNGASQAKVVTKDIATTNGTIHVIDVVLSPDDAVDNIVDTAIDDGRFTTLVTAAVAAELDDDLEGPGPFTVFAPTDTAFAKIPKATLDFLLTPAGQATLIDILTYHVYDGSVLSDVAEQLDGQFVTMLNNSDLQISIVGNEITLNLGGGSEAKVIIKDILCSNGVIHVIDVVLDPADAP